MKVRVNDELRPVELDLNEETFEEFYERLGLQELYPNSFKIFEADCKEVLKFINFFCFDSLRVIKNFKNSNEIILFYNPFQLDNRFIIEDADLLEEVKNHLTVFRTFEPNK